MFKGDQYPHCKSNNWQDKTDQSTIISDHTVARAHRSTFISHRRDARAHPARARAHQPTFISHCVNARSFRQQAREHQSTSMSHCRNTRLNRTVARSHPATFISYCVSARSHPAHARELRTKLIYLLPDPTTSFSRWSFSVQCRRACQTHRAPVLFQSVWWWVN